MRKLFLVLFIVMLAAGAAFADHPQDKLGLGGVFGGALAFDFIGPGDPWFYGYPGLSLKIPNVPIFWAFTANLAHDTTGLGVTGDYYIIDSDMVTEDLTNDDGTYHFNLDWYLGVGMFLDLHFWSDGVAFDMGVRVPVGASWHIIKELELFLAVGPALGIFTGTDIKPRLHFFSFGELGLRYWFK
jgi:hypothetical protein